MSKYDAGSKLPPNIREINESKYVLGKMTMTEEHELCTKNFSIWWQVSRYWEPHIKIGKRNWAALEGDCFTETELRRYDQDDKIPIQVPLALSKLNGFSGFQRRTRRDGVVTGQGPEDAMSAADVNVLIKAIAQQNDLPQENSQLFMNGMVTGFVQIMRIGESEWDPFNKKDLDIYADDWQAGLPDPNFRRFDGSDMAFYLVNRSLTQQQLVEYWPDRAEAINARIAKRDYTGFLMDTLSTSTDRDNLIAFAQNAMDQFERSGLISVVERYHFIDTVREIWVSPNDSEPQILPENWGKARQMQWAQDHPDYQMFPRPIKTLWITTTTLNGVLLENRAHWFQEGMFPFAFFVPAMHNNIPRAWLSYLLDSQKMNSVGRTEYLHSIRFAADKLLIVKEGTLSDPEQAAIEKSKTGGVIFVKRTAVIERDLKFETDQGGNQGFIELSAVAQDDMDTISAINPAMLGQQESANESNVGMQNRIENGQMAQGEYIDNFTRFDKMLHRLIIRMIPYIFTDFQVRRYVDEKDQTHEVEINKPAGFNPLTMEYESSTNNLSGAHYDYVIGAGDNSDSGREHERNVFLTFLQQVMPAIPEQNLPFVLKNMPNKLCLELGKELEEAQKAQQEAMANGEPQYNRDDSRINVNIGGEDIQTNNPIIIDLLVRKGLIDPEAVQKLQPEKSQGIVDQENKVLHNEGVMEPTV